MRSNNNIKCRLLHQRDMMSCEYHSNFIYFVFTRNFRNSCSGTFVVQIVILKYVIQKHK